MLILIFIRLCRTVPLILGKELIYILLISDTISYTTSDVSFNTYIVTQVCSMLLKEPQSFFQEILLGIDFSLNNIVQDALETELW